MALLLAASGAMAAKTIYVPTFLGRDGVNLNDCNTQYCYDRSVQTDNWIIFWEKGFGSDPSTAVNSYKVNMTALKAQAGRRASPTTSTR